jgi:hypothetical protein
MSRSLLLLLLLCCNWNTGSAVRVKQVVTELKPTCSSRVVVVTGAKICNAPTQKEEQSERLGGCSNVTGSVSKL